ncbi:MAG: VWA domain-containing protein [Myxococcota bacterium]
MRGLTWIWLATVSLVVAGLGVLAWLLPLQWKSRGLISLLVLAVVAALGIAASWWLRDRATRRFGHRETLASLVVGRAAPWRLVRATLLVLGLALVALALAGPQYGSRTRVLHKRGIDVVIALDFSKSMLARDVRPSRIERAKAELTQFLQELDGDRVGIVAFAGETMEFPMTVDYAAIGLFLRDLGPYDMPVGGTAIGRALVASQRLLERSTPSAPDDETAQEERSRVVILLTDGEDHEGEPLEAANELANAGIKVYTVGIGSRSGEPIPTYSPDGTWTGYLRDDNGDVVHTSLTAENEEQLTEIAERTGGEYLRARQGGVGIDQVRRHMRALHQSVQESRRITVHENRYALILLPGFLLLILESLLPEAWVGRRRKDS